MLNKPICYTLRIIITLYIIYNKLGNVDFIFARCRISPKIPNPKITNLVKRL